MNNRNFITNNQNQQQHRNFNGRARSNNSAGRWTPMEGIAPELQQQQPPNFRGNQMQQPLYSRDRFNNFEREQQQQQAFGYHEYNCNQQELPLQMEQRQYNCSPPRGYNRSPSPYTRSQLEMEQQFQRDQFNRSPLAGPEFYERHEQDFEQQRQPSPQRYHADQFERSPARGRTDQFYDEQPDQFNCSPERSLNRMPQAAARERERERERQRFSPRRRAAASPPPRGARAHFPAEAEAVTVRERKRPTGEQESMSLAKRKRLADLPALGEPGGRDDPNRKNLCGSRTKWYLRYLKQGFPPDEAIRMAREPVQPAAKAKLLMNRSKSPPPPPPANERTKRSRSRANSRANSKPYEVLPPPAPSPPLLAGYFEDAEQPRGSSSKSRAAAATAGEELRVCLKPKGFPQFKLTHQEKLDLEEGIMQEVAMSGTMCEAPLRFSDIVFKPGYLAIDCANRSTFEWMLRIGSNLPSYYGRPVEARKGSITPPILQKYCITLFLPRGATKSDEYLLGLLKSQNQYNTDLWNVVSRKDQGSGALLVLGIDQASALDIAAHDHSIFYRYSRLPVRGLRKTLATRASPKVPKNTSSPGHSFVSIDIASDNDD